MIHFSCGLCNNLDSVSKVSFQNCWNAPLIYFFIICRLEKPPEPLSKTQNAKIDENVLTTKVWGELSGSTTKTKPFFCVSAAKEKCAEISVRGPAGAGWGGGSCKPSFPSQKFPYLVNFFNPRDLRENQF